MKELPSINSLSIQEKWVIFISKIESTGSIETAKRLSMLTDEEYEKIINQFPDVALAFNQLKYKFKERVVGNLMKSSDNGSVPASIYLLDKYFKDSESEASGEDDFSYTARKMINGG